MLTLFRKLQVPQTIRSQFMILSIVVSLIPLITIAIYSHFIYVKVLNDKVSEGMSKLISTVDWDLNMIISDVKDMSNIIISSDNIQVPLTSKNDDSIEKAINELKITEMITNITINKEYINTILLFNDYIMLYQEKTTFNYSTTDLVNRDKTSFSSFGMKDWYHSIKDNDSHGQWFDGDKFHLNNKNVLLYGKAVKNINTLEYIGMLVIGIDKTIFDRMFSKIRQGSNYNITIVDKSRFIYSTDWEIFRNTNYNAEYFYNLDMTQNGGKGYIYETGDKSYLLTSVNNIATDWKIICSFNYSETLQESRSVNTMAAVLIALSLFIALTGAILITNRITSQLNLLNEATNKLKNDNEIIEIEFDETDEAGRIGSEFIKVIKKNQELNKNLYQAAIKQREAELIALQSQINPHFLYNTLDSIFWMAQKIKAHDISKMAINLSKMFKLTLNHGDQITTIDNEINQIKWYIELQQMRYKNKFSANIVVSQQILNCRMIKLTIQPIVENAIYHGLEMKNGTGLISIKGWLDGDDIVFEIEDDGVGFDTTEDCAVERGYALKNVDERIKLFYGQKYGIKIASEKGVGTIVTIRIHRVE